MFHLMLHFSLLEYAADHRMTQPMVWHFLYQISQVNIDLHLDFCFLINQPYYLGSGFSPFTILRSYGCK